MAKALPQIIVKVKTDEPIDVDAFAAIYTALGSQYRKFVQAHYPELAEDATIYVKQVKKGSIIAELVPWAVIAWTTLPEEMKRVDIVVKFVREYGELLGMYLMGDKKGTKKLAKSATRSDLNDWAKQVSAIANDPNGSAVIEAAVFKDGKKQIEAGFKFKTRDAKRAIERIDEHRAVLDKQSGSGKERVLMVFHQANVRNAPVGKRTGERVRIEEISPKVLPLVYASQLAEDRIKAEIIEADDNLFRKGFVVDVHVATINDRAVAYRVTNVHQVIDLSDDDQESQPALA